MRYETHVLGTISLLAAFAGTARAGVDLGTARDFAVLGASTVTSTGATAISGGHVGVSPGSAITGFPPGSVSLPFTIHANDGIAVQAHADLAIAYNTLAGLPFLPANNLSGQNLGGLTLMPGVYRFNTDAALTGALALDSQGDPNAEFIFQIGTTLITSSGAAVTSNGGAIYWQVGTSATLATNTAFQGSILAHQSITVVSGSSITNGRALAVNAAVTLDTNNISAAAIPEPTSLILAGLAVVAFAGRGLRKRRPNAVS